MTIAPASFSSSICPTLARRRVEEPFDVRPHAHDLVEAFLRDWHAALAV